MGGLVNVKRRANSFAVARDEFRVQQNIMMGFLHECIPITSGNLFKHQSVYQTSNTNGKKGQKPKGHVL